MNNNNIKLKLALDWTPNINHIGFYVAKEKGFFKELNIDVEIISPETDNYKYSPAKKIELYLADIALCPTESIISFRTKKKPFKLYALATIFQRDISAIAVVKSNNIKSPKDLDGRSYASYGARYEDLIVRQLIKNDGGKGNVKIYYPERLGVWNTVANNKYDSTWVFLNWEGIEKPNLRYFKLSDFNIPYSYSPLITTSSKLIREKKDSIKMFLKATKKGFIYSVNNVQESSEILYKYLSEDDKKINLKNALNFSRKYFGGQESFGKINENVFSEFIQWLNLNKIEKIDFDTKDFYLKLDF
tara:strand:+ start:145 stop:1050 length:906 start_codon:yes stop_codon:yes gene_type:complete